MRSPVVGTLSALALVACAGAAPQGPPRPVASASAAPSVSATAPPPPLPDVAPEPDVPLPAVAAFDVGDVGVSLLRSSSPVVEVRIVVRAGFALEGTKPGVSAVLAEALLEGGRAGTPGHDGVVKLEALGARLTARVGRDAAIYSLAAPKAALAEALALTGALLGKPTFGAPELERARGRLASAASQAAATAEFALPRLLHRELYVLPADRHPYATFAPTKAELDAITDRDAKAFHKETYAPKATQLVFVGDVAEADAKAAAQKLGASLGKGAGKSTSPDEPNAPESLRILLVDKPGDAACELRVGLLGRERSAPDWATALVAGEMLGGAAGMPALGKEADVAPTLDDVRSGPGVLGVRVRVTATLASEALGGVLDRMDALASSLAKPEEVEAAARAARQRIVRAYEAPAAAADRLAALATLDVDADADEALRKLLRGDLPNVAVGKTARELFRSGHAVAVAIGDAAKVGPLLAEHGEVRVLDPTKGYERSRSIPAKPKKPKEGA